MQWLDALLDAPQQLMLCGTLLCGLLLGALLQWSRFCLLRGLLHARQQQPAQLQAFALAMAVALLASQFLAWWLDIDLSASVYVQNNPALPVLFVGGLLFGCGMVLANACGARSLVLCASGNLRSLVTLLTLALGAGMAMSGVLAEWRVALENLSRFNLPRASLPLPIGLLLAAVLLACALRGKQLWQSSRYWLGAPLIGLLIAAGWWLSGVVGADEFEPVPLVSLSFIAPLLESQQYLLLSTGTRLSFGIVLVAGVFAGALLRALIGRDFQWQYFETPAKLRHSLLGGLLMGIGGVLALGCTFGQLLSGFSTLAIGSLAAIAGILCGAWLCICYTK